MRAIILAVAVLLFITVLKQLETGGQILLVLWVIGFPVLIAITCITLAWSNIFFTIVKENTVVYVTRGESYYKMLVSMERQQLVGLGRDAKIEECEDGEEFCGDWFFTQILWDWFGIRYYGIPGIHQIVKFKVPGDRLRDLYSIAKVTSIEEAIDHPNELRKVTALRMFFPRPIVGRDVECGKDGVKVDLILAVEFQVIFPYRSVMVYGDESIQQVEFQIMSRLQGIMMRHTYDSFLKLPKQAGSNFSKKFTTGKFMEILLEDFGIVVTQAFVPFIDESEGQKDVTDAMKKSNINLLIGQANIVQAEAAAKVVEIGAKAQAGAIKITGEAEAKTLAAKVGEMVAKGASADTATQAVAAIEATKALPDNLRTLVSPVSFPDSGSKTGTNINVGEGGN